jgi:hypothetical protein
MLLSSPARLWRAHAWSVFTLLGILNFGCLANPMALPSVGSHELRILSPTVLELSLVTTKDPDPATVTTWNFVGPNYSLSLPAVSEFQVLANGSPIAVTEVGFRRRPLYAPLKTRDLRIGNSIFLRLAVPLTSGQSVVVRNPSGNVWNETLIFESVADPRRFNPAIHVNQVGYLPNFSKKAMVGYYLGSMGELAVPTATFHLLDAASGAVRFTGPLTSRRDIGYTYSPTPYQAVLEADFSAFTAPGEYLLQVPGMGVSHRFQIHEGTAAVFARSIALGLYHQRCGTNNTQPFTRHEHGVCHAAPAEVPTAANTAVNATLAGVSYDYADNPLHTASQLNSVDASLYPFVNRGPIDVSGGHHDAGDYSKYTINSAGLIHHLVFAADAFPGVAALDNLGLPESGDGKSDLLQEAKWEADFLAKMQDADGGFYFLVYPRDRRYEDNVLPDSGDPQVVFPKTTAVTAAAVAALAEIASSPTFKAQFPAEAAAYLEKARRGWAFLSAAISTYGKNGSYQKITHYGNEFMHDDELAWAAAALYVATGEAAFHTKLKEWYDPSDANTRRWSWWRLFEGYGCAARTYAFAARTRRLSPRALDRQYLAKCEAEIIAAGDDIARFAQQSAYGTSFPDLNKAYRSAGWYFSTERAFDLAAAEQLAPNPKHLDGLISNMNYEGGCNPVNIPYITGLGWRAWRDIVHQYAQNDYQALPPAGIPLGNVQAGFAYLENYRQSLGQLCYPPDGAASAPYPFYDRWGDSFNTTTEFVVVDQSRSLATYAFLLAKTAHASIPYTRVASSISGIPSSIPADQNITASFAAPGTDLTGARITWEARDQQPFIGERFTFAPKNPGTQWIEAEALLPDGRRLISKTNFTASFSLSLPPNDFQSAPLILTPDLVALYHADGSLSDSSGNNGALVLAGNARLDDLNLGWMAARSGQALRFDDLGDKATVNIPAELICDPNTAEISVEAMVFVESYQGWNRSSAKLLTLERSWEASLSWFEDTYSGPHLRGGNILDCTGPHLAAAMPVGKWHHLQMIASSTGYAFRINGALIASATGGGLTGWNGGSATLELGNFSGWIDEIAIRRKSATISAPALTAPAPATNFQARALSASQMALTWSDAANNEQGYRIYRSTDDVTFNECATAKSNTTACTIGSLAANTRYSFAIKSFNAAGESPDAVATGRTLSIAPPVPTGLKATIQTNAVALTWNPVAGAVAYNVKRSPYPAGPFTTIASNLTATAYSDAPPVRGVIYYYTVTSRNNSTESPNCPAVPAGLQSATANVRLLGVNGTRKGTWIGSVGLEGYLLAGDAQQLPSYASVNLLGKSDWIWEYNTADLRALQRPSATSRLAACWYSPTSFDVELRFTDGLPHKVSLHTIDWDRAGRYHQMDVIDGVTGQVLHICSFGNTTGEGVYLEYQLQGHVKIRYTRKGGPNAVVSGIFFDRAN